MNKLNDKKIKIILFVGAMLLLVLLGLFINYNYELFDNYNLLFDADTKRVIDDATLMGASHYRSTVHPLFIMIVEPLVFLLKGITQNRMLALIILSALTSSLSTLFIYKILQEVKDDKKTNLLISAIYLLAFSNLIFTAGIETYNFAALFLLMLWYYFMKKLKKPFTKESYIILIVLGVLSFSITITNCIIFGIVLLILWLTKRIKFKQAFIVGIITIVSLVGLNVTQKLVWNNTPVLWNLTAEGESTFVENKLTITNITNVIENDYFNSLISPEISLKIKYGNEYNKQNYNIVFNHRNIIYTLLLISFYLSIIILLIRNIKYNKEINIGLLLALLFNTGLHIIYGNTSTFLYALHFLYIIILLLGINLVSEKNIKIKKYFSIYFLSFFIIELVTNAYIIGKTSKIISEVVTNNYLLANIGLPLMILIELLLVILITLGIFFIIKLFNKLVKEKNIEKKVIYTLSIIGIIYLILLSFISLESPKETNRFLGIHLKGNSGEVLPKTKDDYLTKSFKETYKEELIKLKEYEDEYNNFKSTHDVSEVEGANWHDYYYFGLANRRKIVYLENKLVDIETKEVIKEFTEKQHIIIPNLYTVLIECTDNTYIKIFEDEEGVHFNDEIIKGTNTKLNIYDFSKEKYPNMMKVLYGEILFNIKDSVIYPNIIVYDHAWYRDAAVTAMLLKRTNNLDLIKDWVTNINDIYDRQNSGIEEADNLGELLYLISTQEERNEELINRIITEAERIAKENPNGYYLYGKTDFGDQYLYQNLWYKLGIEAVGKTFNFDLSTIPEDNYSKMSWWSNYEVKDKTPNELSNEYPYLSYASNHKMHNGTIPMNKNNYPLSWEMVASNAKYNNYSNLQPILEAAKISPLHSWSASELLLLLLDE